MWCPLCVCWSESFSFSSWKLRGVGLLKSPQTRKFVQTACSASLQTVSGKQLKQLLLHQCQNQLFSLFWCSAKSVSDFLYLWPQRIVNIHVNLMYPKILILTCRYNTRSQFLLPKLLSYFMSKFNELGV